MATQQNVLLPQFMEMIKTAAAQHPPARRVLRISKAALGDWQRLKQSDWEAAGWEGEDQELTSLSSPRDVYLRALERRLGEVGISRVEVVDTPYMEIVPGTE